NECNFSLKSPVSCRNRCFEPYDRETQGCHCDAQCIASNNCCYDFQDICLQPTESWECTALRCGEKRISGSKCHCSADCLSAGDCCTNYNMICNGVKSWVEDECVNMTTPKCPANFKRQPLLLISLDGLRAEYQQTWHSLIPVLDKLRTCGTSTAFMQPVFPTVTFPNHYSIVTGLYTESHGLVHNSMYDPVFDASFSLSNEEKTEPRWYLGQPIWHTAMYQGLRAGTFFWPGSDVEINGSFPNIYEKFDGTIPYELRILTVLKWLQLPDDQRPDFMTLYMEEPDKSGHNYGPVSGGVISALQKVDIALGQLMNGLKQLNLHECINIIVLADHGMVETSCDRREVLQDIVGDISNLYVYEGALGRIRCKKPDQQIKAYLKHHLPQRFHYINSRRIEDVSVLVNPRWLFERYPGSLKYCTGGTHGYDNDEPSMQVCVLSVTSCYVLEITPAENNGTHGSLNHILQSPPYSPQYPLEQSSPGQCPLTSLEPTDPLGCSCPALVHIATSERKHLPFGRPRVLQSQSNYCLLHHEGFASGYSRDIYMPLWSSFTIEKPVRNKMHIYTCTYTDIQTTGRNNTNPSGLTPGPKNERKASTLNSEQHYDGLILSNVVPVYPEFKKIWQYFQEVLLLKYSSQYNGINVVTGPAFYYNHNGAADQIQFVAGTRIPIPTHYFAVLTTCLDSNQPVSVCVGELYTMCFILPHRPDNSESCMSNQAESTWVEDLVWFHQARISDVELLTGLNFFQDSGRPIPEVLRVKTRPTAAIHRKT
uniref:SMB domain-containing protein n=1 Tax=Pygocentrus nattereri TaxID=42514 RepID=A0AAR2KZR1_PYGNA